MWCVCYCIGVRILWTKFSVDIISGWSVRGWQKYFVLCVYVCVYIDVHVCVCLCVCLCICVYEAIFIRLYSLWMWSFTFLWNCTDFGCGHSHFSSDSSLHWCIGQFIAHPEPKAFLTPFSLIVSLCHPQTSPQPLHHSQIHH
jgi:hypothetical protein